MPEETPVVSCEGCRLLSFVIRRMLGELSWKGFNRNKAHFLEDLMDSHDITIDSSEIERDLMIQYNRIH